MITTYENGHREHPEDLLRRFGARFAILERLAYATLLSVEFANEAKSVADPVMDTELAEGIQELHSDFRQMRSAIETFVGELKTKAHGGAR